MVHAERSAGVDLTFELRLTGEGGGVWTVHVKDGFCDVRAGFSQRADVRYTADAQIWCGVALGLIDARDLYRAGPAAQGRRPRSDGPLLPPGRARGAGAAGRPGASALRTSKGVTRDLVQTDGGAGARARRDARFRRSRRSDRSRASATRRRRCPPTSSIRCRRSASCPPRSPRPTAARGEARSPITNAIVARGARLGRRDARGRGARAGGVRERGGRSGHATRSARQLLPLFCGERFHAACAGLDRARSRLRAAAAAHARRAEGQGLRALGREELRAARRPREPLPRDRAQQRRPRRVHRAARRRGPAHLRAREAARAARAADRARSSSSASSCPPRRGSAATPAATCAGCSTTRAPRSPR